MATNPSKLDVIDSGLPEFERTDYLKKLDELETNLGEYWKFEIVPNVFKQSLKETDGPSFSSLDEHFGALLPWPTIVEKLHHFNKESSDDEKYKLLFLARHGQGFHNLAHARYGNDAWNEYWSKLNGDGDIVWGPDPLLTELGISQARENQDQWKIEISRGAPLPQKWYVSPLRRSMDTLINTWDQQVDFKVVHPYICENLREQMGVHTCDKRSPKSALSSYEEKGFIFEPGFAEEDIYYQDDYREAISEQAIRMNKFLQEMFTTNNDESVCLTSHSGSIRAQLLVLGHRPFPVGTGGMIPVMVKATRSRK